MTQGYPADEPPRAICARALPRQWRTLAAVCAVLTVLRIGATATAESARLTPTLAGEAHGAFVMGAPAVSSPKAAHRVSTDALPDLTEPAELEASVRSEPLSSSGNIFADLTRLSVLTIGTSFDGLSQSGFVPPDANIAVGLADIVQTANKRFRIFTRTGVIEFTQNLTGIGLWSGLGVTGTLFNPKCLYDQYNDRFVIVMLELVGTTSSHILLAISDDGNPMGTWFTYRTNATTVHQGTNCAVYDADLGVNAAAYYVTGNLYDLATGLMPLGLKHRIFNKTPLLTGAAATFNDINTNGANLVAAHCHGTTTTQFFATLNGNAQVRLFALRPPNTPPFLTSSLIAVPTFTAPSGTIPNLTASGGCGLSPGDGRLLSLMWRNGQLVTAHAVRSGSEQMVRWYQFNTNNWPVSGSPSFAQSGTIDPGGVAHAWLPAIAQNSCNQVAVVVARAADAEPQSIQVTGRTTADAAGTMQPLTLIKNSATGYCPPSNLFGSYFDLVIDPVDDETFWCVGQWASDLNVWQTRVASFMPASCCTGPSIANISNVSWQCGVAYQSPLPSVAGTPPFVWTLVAGTGSGIGFNEDTGVVSWGVPFPAATPRTFTIQAANACGVAMATWTVNVKPGDFTFDGQVTSSDLAPFTNHLLNLSNTRPCAADVDLNGVVDGRDAQAFVRCLFGPACP